MTPKLAATLLRLTGWGFIIFCTVFVTIAFEGYDGIARHIANLFDWTGPTREDTLSRDARWFGAIWAGMGAALGALYIWLVAPLLMMAENREVQNIARRGGQIVAGFWYIIDSAGSFAAGVPSNVAMNTIFLLCIAVPLMTVKFEQRAG